MPKVAIDEYRDLSLDEDDVWAPGKHFDMRLKFQAARPKGSAHKAFEARVAPFDSGHTVAALLRSEIIHSLHPLSGVRASIGATFWSTQISCCGKGDFFNELRR